MEPSKLLGSSIMTFSIIVDSNCNERELSARNLLEGAKLLSFKMPLVKTVFSLERLNHLMSLELMYRSNKSLIIFVGS